MRGANPRHASYLAMQGLLFKEGPMSSDVAVCAAPGGPPGRVARTNPRNGSRHCAAQPLSTRGQQTPANPLDESQREAHK